jgi:hypothetical protein
MFAMLVTVGGSRLACEIECIRHLPIVRDSALIAKMRTYAGRTSWVYVDPSAFNIYAFHAGELVPPELAVLSGKRFWSGQITNQDLLETVKCYKPEQLLFGTVLLDSAMQEYVTRNYRLVLKVPGHWLYAINSFPPE